MESLPELRRRRLALGIPLGELARAVGRSDATLSRVERGQIRPSYELVQKIVEYLDTHEGVATRPLTAGDVMNRTVVTIEANADVGRASQLLERGGFSQLPVLDGGRVTGAVSETGLLRALARPNGRRVRVREIQDVAYPQVDATFPADLLTVLLGRYPAVLVLHRGDVSGIITRSDLIRGLRGATLRRPKVGPGDAPPPA